MNIAITDHISPNFTWDEFIGSTTATRMGIDNLPGTYEAENLMRTANGLEEVRKFLGNKPIHVDSAYRCLALNKAVGGSTCSDHLYGWAVDFICPDYGTPKQICLALSHNYAISFDTMIFEGTWVHISFKPTNRRDLMTAHFSTAGTTYTDGIA